MQSSLIFLFSFTYFSDQLRKGICIYIYYCLTGDLFLLILEKKSIYFLQSLDVMEVFRECSERNISSFLVFSI